MVNECKLLDDVLALIKSGSNIIRPLDWISFRLEPYQVEFWQGSKDRFYKRLIYNRKNNEPWQKQWLQP